MKYLVIGSGGREHALAWRLLSDGSADEVYVAPGNGGIEERYRAAIAVDDFPAIESYCREKMIDIVVVGPEAPLVAGLVDFLTERKIPAFGPTKAAAQLEGSKLFAKYIMEKYGVPTAGHRDFTSKADLVAHIETIADYPIVIKLDGLAAGKGVGIPESKMEALEFIDKNVRDGVKVFVEDFLDGEEASVLGISDGETVLPFIAAQDHKRVFDGDRGPNTGGMGAYAPAPVANDAVLERVRREVLVPVVRGMKNEGVPFKGILYAGVIIQGDSIKVLEFNVRFGDPETQVLLPLLNGRLGDCIQASIAGSLHECALGFKQMSAVTVVMASAGYPEDYPKGLPISGLDSVSGDLIVFHAGTKIENGACVTNGGRVLNVTALGESFQSARDKVYGEIGKIRFDGAHYRKDIGHRAMKRGG